MPTALRILIVVLLALALPATAQVYKWVDKDGKVHYSDKPPRDPNAKNVKDMNIQSNPTDESAVAAEQEALKMRGVAVDGEIAERQKGQADAAAKKAQAADRERQCANAKADLNVLTRVNRLVGVDANNQEKVATGAELEAKRAQARSRVAELCD